ncbi:MAG: ATP-binding protein [Bacteroidales bacterium]|nr:ATP-binding protein [Candidatus Liminaster caballi]
MKAKMTIGSAFETIAKVTKDSEFKKEAMDAIAKEGRFLKRIMGLTMMQSYIVSVILEKAGETVTCLGLAEYADVSPIRIMTIHSQIDDLVKRGFLNEADGRSAATWNMRYTASCSLISAVRNNHDLLPYDYCETTSDDMWQMIAGMLYDCDYSSISYPYMVQQIKNLFANCGHIDFCRKVNEQHLMDDNLVLLLVICNCLVNKSEDYACTNDYEDIIPTSIHTRIIRQFKSKTHELIKKDLVKAKNEDCDEFCLTKNGILHLLGQEYLGSEKDESEQPSRNIVAKEMFYNADEASQIERLTNLLSQDNFIQIQARMRKVGMRPGFCTIFHGAPGTGKTETVLQLARKTGREIVQVDLSSIKDKYVGESEKRIQAVFTDYGEKLAESDVAPILFFNEADAIFGKRHTDVNSEVEQMSNAMQNIILQAMENFEGILVATTNLTDNLDAAFERRFLYKIEFKKPSTEVRKKIWLSMIPELGEKNAEVLASRYDFSGGQIENVARRMMVDAMLYGRTLTGKEVISVCDEELFGKKKALNINKKSA